MKSLIVLNYIGAGRREYGSRPLSILRRSAWEFQAVLKGSIGLLLEEGPDILRQRRLWLFPPRHAHGWVGERNRSAEIVVFHFMAVPEPLRQLAGGREYLEVTLDEEKCRRLRELAKAANRYWGHPAPGMFLCYEHVLLELSLLVFEANATADAQNSFSSRQRVNEAIQRFAAKMENNPSLEDIAKEVGASAVHLRRLFHEVLQAAPKQIFDQLRFQRAMQLMTEPGMKLESVGEACGFQSASAFSRAFKIKFGCSPQRWRG